MIFSLGNFIYTYFFVVRSKHYYPGTIGSFFLWGGGGSREWRGKVASVTCSLQVPYLIEVLVSSLQTSSVMYITGQGVVLGDNAIGRGRGGVPVVFPVQQTGGVVNIPGCDAQMASMPPQDSQEPDLLLVPLEMPAMPSQRVVEETGQPPPYDGDTHSSSQDPDLLLVPLEVTAMPPQSVVQETGPPPPYDQISSCSTVGPSSGAEGDQPPQVSVKYKLRYVLVYSQIRCIALRVLQTSKEF